MGIVAHGLLDLASALRVLPASAARDMGNGCGLAHDSGD